MKFENKNLKLSPPWFTYCNELKAVFSEDPEVTVENLDEENFNIKVTVSNNYQKFEALKKILKTQVYIGNITVNVDIVYDGSKDSSEVSIQDFKAAFAGNPKFVDAVTKDIKDPTGSIVATFPYAIFSKEIVQFYNDDMSDYCANFNGILADVVKDVINDTGVFINSESK